MIRYSKRGAVLRLERARGERTMITIRESGEASEDGDSFEARPSSAGEHPTIPEIDLGDVDDQVIRLATENDLVVERLVATAGTAHHRCDERTWLTSMFRLHLSLIHPRRSLRCFIDVGDDSSLLFAEGAVRRIAASFAACSTTRPVKRLVLAPAVSASVAHTLREQRLCTIAQRGGGIDGYGEAIVDAHGPPWPNAFRPSYRFRPMLMPFNLRAEPFGTLDDADAEGVALLQYPDGLRLDVLCRDHQGPFASRVTIRRVLAVDDSSTWFPFGAGVHGARMLVEVEA